MPSTNETDYPPSGFCFSITLLGDDDDWTTPSTIDAVFQEVAGISQLDPEDNPPEDENRFVHRLPKSSAHSPLILKRGEIILHSAFGQWIWGELDTAGLPRISPRKLLVMLIDDRASPLAMWGVSKGYPIRWAIDPIDSINDKITVATVEFSYLSRVRVSLESPPDVSASLSAFNVGRPRSRP